MICQEIKAQKVIDGDDESFDKVRRRMIAEIKAVMDDKPKNVALHYMALLRHQKRRLLIEKLRRLTEESE